MGIAVKGSFMKLLKFYPKVYIIIINYNSWADTIECLESVLRNNYPNYQVIVIDNNSPNNSMEYLKAWAEGKLDVWVKPNHPLRYLSFPPVKKPIPYIYKEVEGTAYINSTNNLKIKFLNRREGKKKPLKVKQSLSILQQTNLSF
jgi:GT2 family glycosyltransferase